VDDYGLGLDEPKKQGIADVLQGIGQGLEPGYGHNPHIPKGASFIGSALKSFGESRAAQGSLARSSAIERKIKVPIDFFLRLSKEAQQSILEKSGMAERDPLKVSQQLRQEGLETRANATQPLTIGKLAADIRRTTGMEDRDVEKQPYALGKLKAEKLGAEGANEARSALTDYRKFKTSEGKALSESNPVPESVLQAARLQGFSQLQPGTQVSWKEFRAITKNSAAMNAYADALTETISELSRRQAAGQQIDENAINTIAENVSSRLRGFIGNDSIKALKQSIIEQWKMQQGMVGAGAGVGSILPYGGEAADPMLEEDDLGGSEGLYP